MGWGIVTLENWEMWVDCPWKWNLIRSTQSRYRVPTFIETGSGKGGTIDKVKDMFDNIASIETNDELFHLCCDKFRDEESIHLWHGDSGWLLEPVINSLPGPYIFFLDAHEMDMSMSPLTDELITIFSLPEPHVIFIDDIWWAERTNFNTIPSMDAIRDMMINSGHDFFTENFFGEMLGIFPKKI